MSIRYSGKDVDKIVASVNLKFREVWVKYVNLAAIMYNDI